MNNMEILTTAMDNWEAIAAGLLICIASLDKVAIIAINSLGNIREAWRNIFPKNKWDNE